MAVTSEDVKSAKRWVYQLVYHEKAFLKLAIVYGLAISLLTLAVPIAVQTLINTVVNIASVGAVVSLAVILFVTMALSGLLSALRTYVMEKYERHIYSRLTAEISVRTLMTSHTYFSGRRNVDIPNRYFDITTFQRNIPALFIDGFALILQLLVGFTLVSFYHTFFFLYCILLTISLYLIWVIWSRGAIASSIKLSHSKYATAKWLGDVATAHSFFKSGRHIEYAQRKTEQVSADYIKAHREHFRYTFTQTIALLIFYALASSALLGLGGYLVIQGQLSIGQLVAAELILTAIFFGLSKAANYLKMYYQLCGAADELAIIFKMPINPDMTLEQGVTPKDGEIQFNNVHLDYESESYVLDATFKSGSKIFVLTSKAWVQSRILGILKNHCKAKQGYVRLGQHDITEYKHQQLNNPPLTIINKSPILECSILDFMKLSAPDISVADVQDVFEKVGLTSALHKFESGLNTKLSPLGAPLQPHQFLLLKLASALLVQPKLLILNQYFDNFPQDHRARLIAMLEKEPFTVLYFTNRMENEAFDYCLCLDWLKRVN